MNSSLSREQQETYQHPDTIRRILREANTIAMVGLSSKSQKASQFVATYLQYKGYNLIPVHPKADSILGNTAYPTLEDIPEPVDVVDVFRPPRECPTYAEQAATIDADALWLQLGIVSLDAAEIAEANGLDIVMDRCMKMEHGRYQGGMHAVGMNTGVISAKRGRRTV